MKQEIGLDGNLVNLEVTRQNERRWVSKVEGNYENERKWGKAFRKSCGC